MQTSKRWISVAAVVLIAFPFTAFAIDDLDEFRSLVEEGRPDEALEGLEEHLEDSPVDPEAMFLRGLLLAEGSREQEAKSVFQEIVDLRPDRPEPLNNLAVIQAAMGEYETAVETLKEALRTHPAYRTAYENLTKIYGQLASEAYSRALSVDQAHARSAVELVLLSEMTLPKPEVALMAEAEAAVPVAPLPSAAEAAPAVAGEMDPPEAVEQEAPVMVADAEPEEAAEEMHAEMTPDEAINEVLSESGGAAVEWVEGDESMAEEPMAADEPMMPAPPMPSMPENEEPTEEPDTEEPAAEETEAEAAESMESAPVESMEPAPDTRAVERVELATLVEAWALAWSEQRVEDYLYFYGEEFEPADGLPRADWETLRRQRISAPEFIKVSIAFLDFEITDAAHAAVRFNQSYESDTFSDVVTKTLKLTREVGGWKIVRESVDP